MKKITLVLFLFLMGMIAGKGQSSNQVTTATLIITNVPTGGMGLNLNSGSWTWTNDISNPCTEIYTYLPGTITSISTINQSATNLWNSIIGCPPTGLNYKQWNSSNQFIFSSSPGVLFSVSVIGNWCTVIYQTNFLSTPTIAVRVPPSAVSQVEKTNVESGLATYLGDNAGTNKVGTNAPMFSPWYNWIASIVSAVAPSNFLSSFIVSSNGLGTNTVFYDGEYPTSPILWPITFTSSYWAGNGKWALGNNPGGGFVFGSPLGQAQITYLNGVNGSNGVTEPFSLYYSPAVPNSSGGTTDGIGIEAAVGWFNQLYVGGLPVGSGSGSGSGSGGTVGSGGNVSSVVQSLYTVNYNPTVGTPFNVPYVTVANVPLLSPINGTFTNAAGATPMTISYGGNTYTVYSDYAGPNGGHFSWNNSGTNNANLWEVYTYSTPPPTYTPWMFNYTFNFIAAGWNGSNIPYNNATNVTVFPVVTNGVFSSSATVAWGLGNNWLINISGTNVFNLSLAQDWNSGTANQVEFHKIFLTSVTNCSVAFSQGTNQWFWQNRQGLAAQAPSTIASNETITISLNHIGGQTNWLATWETSAATNGISTNGSGGLTVTNWTVSSNVYTNEDTVYTNTGPSGIAFIQWTTSTGDSFIIHYTNNGVAFTQYSQALATSTEGVDFPINNGGTFSFHGGNYVTNGIIWYLPH